MGLSKRENMSYIAVYCIDETIHLTNMKNLYSAIQMTEFNTAI